MTRQSSQISLIYPFDGNRPLLERFLESACGQELDGMEAIIVASRAGLPHDDGFSKFARKGLSITACPLESPLQPMQALIAGIEMASAPAIALFPWGGTFHGRKNLAILLEKSRQCRADIFQFREIRVDETGTSHNDLPYAFAGKPLGGQEIAGFFMGNSHFFHSVSSKLFSRSLLQRTVPALKMLPLQEHFDDSLFLLPCLAHAHAYAECNLPGHALHLGKHEDSAALYARCMATFLALKKPDLLGAACRFQPVLHDRMLGLLHFLSASYCGKMCANMADDPELFSHILPADIPQDFFEMLLSGIRSNGKKLESVRKVIKSVQA